MGADIAYSDAEADHAANHGLAAMIADAREIDLCPLAMRLPTQRQPGGAIQIPAAAEASLAGWE